MKAVTNRFFIVHLQNERLRKSVPDLPESLPHQNEINISLLATVKLYTSPQKCKVFFPEKYWTASDGFKSWGVFQLDSHSQTLPESFV
jgi:hypothetical protein